MWFDVEAQDLSFTERSPFHIENEAIINAPAARVFEVMALGENQREWFQDFVEFRWTSPPPHHVAGSEREVELKMLTVKERFLVWEPGKRLTFTIYGITLPFVTAMVEDLHFQALNENQTRFVWRVHYRPRAVVRVFHPILRAVFGKLFAASTHGLARYVTTHAANA
jgi:uncharacterized protein YndB with AHSA1/START domain